MESTKKKQKKKNQNKNGRRARSCLLCSDPRSTDVDRASTSAPRFDRAAVVAAGDGNAPTHLVVMVNGIIGSAGHWKYAAKQLVKSFPNDVLVFRSRCNSNWLTFAGVDIMGERLAKEVSSVVAHCPEITKISFVAHSLGGLVARYAIAKLYEPHEEKNLRKHLDLENESVEDGAKGKIAGLDPVNFITLATPHLGSRWHRQIPFLCGFYSFEKMAVHTSNILGRTGMHLCLSDMKNGKHPLLLRMVCDNGDLKFISALQSFKTRVAYSNARSDYIVGWKTSSIRRQNELPKIKQFKKDDRYPHIIYLESPKSTILQEEVLLPKDMEIKDIEETMIKGLNAVSWERVDVSFKSLQRFMAHTTILVKSYWMNSHGSDVIYHMINKYFNDKTSSIQHSEGGANTG